MTVSCRVTNKALRKVFNSNSRNKLYYCTYMYINNVSESDVLIHFLENRKYWDTTKKIDICSTDIISKNSVVKIPFNFDKGSTIYARAETEGEVDFVLIPSVPSLPRDW